VNQARPPTPSPWNARVEEYLDGAMNPEDRHEFEAQLARDGSLREQVELHGRIDQSLGRLFEEASAHRLTGAASDHGAMRLAAGRGSRPRSRMAWYGAAAALLLVALGVWMFWPRPAAEPSPARFVSAQQAYISIGARGFTPQWVCESDQEFAAAVETRLGQALVVPLATPGVEVRGWSYGNPRDGFTLSTGTMILMARVENDDILVFMDRAENDRGLKLDDDPCNMKIFRKQVGGIVLYEVTTREAPAVLDAAVIP